jgi:hypothetical protein
VLEAVGQVPPGEHGDAGDHHGTELQAGDHGDLPLGATGQHDHDPVALGHPPPGQDTGQTIGGPGDLGKGEALLGAGLVAPDEGQSLLIGCQSIDHLDAEIERLRNLPAKVLAGLRVVAHGRKIHGLLLDFRRVGSLRKWARLPISTIVNGRLAR